MTKKIYIDYTKFEEKLIKLYRKIQKSESPSVIIGIANGGLNVSKPLSNWFQCKHIEISIHFYDADKVAGKPYYANIPPIPVDWKNILLVDDVLDTGTTIKYFMEQTHLVQGVNFKIATLHWNPQGEYGLKPDFFVDKKKKDTWIVYPWETEYTETF